MKTAMKHILSVCILTLLGQFCLAGPIDDLAGRARPGFRPKLSGVPLMEVVVISDCTNENVALNPNLNFREVDMAMTRKTVYVQEPGGSRGMRLIFDSKSYNDLQMYDVIVLDVNGGRLRVNDRTGSVTVAGLTPLAVVSRRSGSEQDAPVKERLISELTDADIFTRVTLKDMEFAFKDGAIINIKENYGQYVEKYHKDYKKEVNYRMDGGRAMMKDAHGNAIGMAVNTLCNWRRDGDGVPQGSGMLTGIITDEQMRRYGSNTGRYLIRPLEKSDIKIDPKKKSSAWTMLTGWILDGFNGKQLDYEKAGPSEQPQTGDRIMSDTGAKAYLWTDSGARTYTTSDWNNITSARQGAVWHGAIMFDCMARDWYNWDNMGNAESVNSIFLEFSAAKVKSGQPMQLCFELTAGDVNMVNSWGFPARWQVQCSIDGGEFKTLPEACTADESFSLRPLPCWCKKVNTGKYNKNFNTQYDFGMGSQGHVFNLPEEAAGKEKVVVRLMPAGRMGFALRSHPHEPAEVPGSYDITRASEAKSLISFGSIFIEYKK